jgi:hypothetical protein
MELNTFFTEDDCGSNSHSTGRGRGRGRVRVGGRSQGSALSRGSNPGGATSGGRSAGGSRSTTSGRGCGQGSMLPPTEGSLRHPKRKHGPVSGADESGSTASGSSTKRPRKIISSNEKLSDLARTRLRKEACEFFSKNSMQFLERMYLSSGKAGLDSLKKHLLNLFLLALHSDDEYLRDRQILHYQDRVQDIVQEAIFNPIACYVGVFKNLPDDESAKPDLLLKIERFAAKAVEVKAKGRNTLPKFIQDDLAKKIATQNHQGVLWLPRHTVIVPKDNNRFEGGYGVVRMVEIHEVEAIPPYIEFAGKTMKLKDNLEYHKSRSTEALACLVDHPRVITVMYLDRRTYESFTLWWNGGSLFAMRHYDRKYKHDQHESEPLF